MYRCSIWEPANENFCDRDICRAVNTLIQRKLKRKASFTVEIRPHLTVEDVKLVVYKGTNRVKLWIPENKKYNISISQTIDMILEALEKESSPSLKEIYELDIKGST